MTRPVTQTTYANAQVRGQLRLWKTGLARQYRQFDNAYRSGEWQEIVEDFVKRKSDIGRHRAYHRLTKLFGAGTILEGLRIDGNTPLAIWSLFKPRESVAVDAEPESGRSQNCVTVNYVLAGAWPMWPDGFMIGVTEGLWTLEVPDHALGRAMERSGMLPGAIILDAHHNLLRIRAAQIAPDGDARRKFIVGAGGGGFICELIFGTDISLDGGFGCHVFARTWLASNQLYEDQALLADDGEPGRRLGDTWLVPAVLRRLRKNSSGRIECATAAAAMPSLLSVPMGNG